jgi:Family of unknown function (DUF5752)
VGASEPFALFDGSIARYALGKTCTNLRELLEAVRTASDATLEHHMIHCALDDHFELYEFPNDLARWCWDGLGDDALAEQLALVDPYQCATTAELRTALINVVEDRSWQLERVPWSRPGFELHLIESRVIAYDTGERFATLRELSEALPTLSLQSLFHHVHQARRRSAGRTDDFSDWVERQGGDPALVARLRAVDFYFLNLNQVRHDFSAIIQHYVSEPQRVMAGAAEERR